MQQLRQFFDHAIQLLPHDVLIFLGRSEVRWGIVGVLWLLLAYRLFGKVSGGRQGWMSLVDWLILASVSGGMWMIFTAGERSW